MPHDSESRSPQPPGLNPPTVGRGLRLFASTASAGHRRRRWIFVAILIAAAAAVGWPGLALMARPRPFVLGLPMPFAWIIAWLLVVFAALVWLYRCDYSESQPSVTEDDR